MSGCELHSFVQLEGSCDTLYLRNKNPQKLHRATRSLHKLRDMSAFNFSTKMAEERWFCECEYLEDFSKMNL